CRGPSRVLWITLQLLSAAQEIGLRASYPGGPSEREQRVLEWKQGMQENKSGNEAAEEWVALQARVAKQLREIAADIAAEPIPQRFLDLLPPDRPPPAGAPMRARIP